MYIDNLVKTQKFSFPEEYVSRIIKDIQQDKVRWISDSLCEWHSMLIECMGPDGRISTIKIREQ